MADIVTYLMTTAAPLVLASVIKPRPEHTHNRIVYKATYEASFLLSKDHPDWEPIRSIMRQVATKGLPNVADPSFPVQTGDAMAAEAKAKGWKGNYDWAPGKIILRAKAAVAKANGELLYPPRLVAVVNDAYLKYGSEERPRAMAAPYFYNGVNVRAELSFVAYEAAPVKDMPPRGYVAVYLNEVLSLNTGEKLAGGEVDPADKYGAVEQYKGHVSAIDPTAGLHGLV